MSSLKYLIAGTANTIFGYTFSLILYYNYISYFNIIIILILNNFISISFSFLTYKIYVFRTKGNWLSEYLRCYVVYGFTALVSSTILWILVEIYDIQYWFAQLFSVISIIIISFLLHKNFTFK